MESFFRKGDQGCEVADIQNRLSIAGFLNKDNEDVVEERFGSVTERAVRAFQRANELSEDGIVGDTTWKALVASSRILGNRPLYLTEPPMKGSDVAEVQKQLYSLGFFLVKDDGIFGEVTALAVRCFQESMRLDLDGIVGLKTIKSLKGNQPVESV